jgi:hypothetical protein
MVARLGLGKLAQYGRGHRGRELLTRQTVSAPNHARRLRKISSFLQGDQDILI